MSDLRTVPVVGTGVEGDPRRPDLPDGTAFSVLADHGGTMDVDVVDVLLSPEQAANDATLRQQARDSLDTLRTSIDTLKAITDKTNAEIGPRDTKDVARETRRVARQVLALTRLLIGALDSADAGTE